jgi:myo-inositol-1(or 4)-monophosphatase
MGYHLASDSRLFLLIVISNMSHTEFTPEHLKEIYDFAVQLAKDAGRMLMDGVEARYGSDGTAGVQQEQVEKDSSVDIVTQTDEGS